MKKQPPVISKKWIAGKIGLNGKTNALEKLICNKAAISPSNKFSGSWERTWLRGRLSAVDP